MDRTEQLERLATLLSEGTIRQDEYDILRRDLLADGQSSVHVDTRNPDAPPPKPVEGNQAYLLGTRASRMLQAFKGVDRGQPAASETPALYKAAVGMGVVSVFFGGTIGLLAWATVAVSGWALYTLTAQKRRWMAWTGLALGLLFSFMNAYLNGHLDQFLAEGTSPESFQLSTQDSRTFDSSVEQAPPVTQPTPLPTEPPLAWTVGACAREDSNGFLWSLTPCSSSYIDGLVIDTPLLSSNCPTEADFYVELSGVRVACLMEKVVRPWTTSP